MMRLTIWIVAVLAIAGCNKPSEGDCRKAIANMQHLMGTENLRDPALVEGEVRRCKGGSKKKAVQCAMAAQTLEELQKCEFYHVPANAKGVGTVEPTGSAGSAGSAVEAGSAGSAGSAVEAGSAGSAGSAVEAGSGSAGAAMGGAGGGSAGGAMGGAGAGSAGAPAGSAGSAAGSAGSAK
ncbi:MAG: hypothetical protein HOV81_43675 [Kofleriaceae bacterium]|nr:hypothetical protein [Kofleriaceae bacterium]